MGHTLQRKVRTGRVTGAISECRRTSSPIRTLLPAAIVLGLLALASGCTYLRYTSVQKRYEAQHDETPRQWLAKHVLGKDTWFVYGRLLETPASAGATESLSVVALSNRYRPNEVVEVNRLGKAASYFGMNLPQGEYRLLVLADSNGNGIYDEGEVVGETAVHLASSTFPDKVAGSVDIALVAPYGVAIPDLAAIAVPIERPARESLFFPKGALRSIDDPIFSEATAQMGIYDPAAFVEIAPMMFYALEEDAGYKVPVVFVHGIGGSPRQFSTMVEGLDRTRSKPWFFYYPSGADLEQLARLFHDVFLSGRVIPREGAPMVIVAHSMGGLVVREAMNLRTAAGSGVDVAAIVTLATPFGGDPSARLGVDNAPIVPPAWRDLDPAGAFIQGLFRQPLPPSTEHHLIYAYRSRDDIARGSDGVVPLAQQLPAPALRSATRTYGFEAEHTAILRTPRAVDSVAALVAQVKNPLPEEHLRLLAAGGFDVPLGEAYGARERHALETYGRYLRALANGALAPIHPEQRHFVAVTQGTATPTNDFESAWLKFRADYPDLAASPAP